MANRYLPCPGDPEPAIRSSLVVTNRIPPIAWRAARVLGVWLLAWVWAAEAQEPSYANAAPSAPASYALALPAGTDINELAASDATVYRAEQQPRVVRRRWVREPPYREPQGWMTLRAGFFDGDDAPENSFVYGAKFVGNVAPSLRLGVSTDIQHRGEDITVHQAPNVEYTLAEVDTDLIPLMGLLEFHMPLQAVRPYFGVGAGYEWLIVDVNDYAAGVFYEDDFGGFGWQAYGGMNIRLAPNVELGGEAYWNDSTVSREIYFVDLGAVVKEEVDVDGVGFRGGVSFGF